MDWVIWVGLGLNISGLGWVGLKKIDPRPSLTCTCNNDAMPNFLKLRFDSIRWFTLRERSADNCSNR